MTENKGNLITRRAFAKRDGADLHRVPVLARTTGKAMSTAYQMTEEVGEYGSGTPSPLHVLCELIRVQEEYEREEGGAFSSALELAEYPLAFLREMRAEVAAGGDAAQKLNFLLKNISDANYLMRGRALCELTLGELREYGQRILTAATLARELSLMVDEQIEAKEARYPGAPFQRERVAALR